MKRSKAGATFVVMLGALLVFSSIVALAQTTSRGTITGTITDPTGAVVANTSVTITSIGTGVSRESTSNSAGIYRFEAIDLGNYTVAAQAPGFATMRKSGIEVQAARVLEIDFTLKVGQVSDVVVVEASAAEVGLQTSEQVRGAHIPVHAISSLPVAGLDTLTLAQTVPGVLISGQGTAARNINQNGTFVFTANGQRPRGNSFLIDGVENNDISVTGPAYTITNPDAVEEVNIQTSNFSAEFGRAGGAVFNQITRSGTNSFHGSASYIYTGSAFKSLNFNQKIGGLTRPPRDIENIPSFSVGGPVYFPKLYDGRKKTFFFAAAQWDREYGQATSSSLLVPSVAGVAVLQALAAFPACSNVALYLQALGSLRAVSQFSNFSIAAPSAAGTCNASARTNQVVQFGQVVRLEPAVALDNNHQIRIDHVASNKQTMSWRWLYDKSSTAPGFNNLPGFDNANTAIALSMAFTDTYVINPRWTNEFRFNYGRIGFDFPSAAADAFHTNLPNFFIAGIAGFGLATNIPQFRFANNWQYADTMTFVHGTHTFRFGADFLRQLARQHPPFNERGSLRYLAAGATTGLANFIDDFGGRGGRLNRLFGDSIYHPNLFRHSYFFQDSWKVRNDLVLNLGLRYENYGSPVNTFKIAAFTDYDPVNFGTPHKVDPDNNNFAPSVGFAWSPSGRILGQNKTVIRGGYQISYDTYFNNLLSNIAGDSPNALSFTFVSPNTGRGTPGWGVLFAGTPATPLTRATAQNNLFIKDMVNPYTQRWSLGFQREVPGGLIVDVAYVGSVSRKLYRSIDMNPVVNDLTGDRLHQELQISAAPSTRRGQGIRTVRASSANSNYNSLQVEVRRRFAPTPLGNFAANGAYTWGHSLDEISDVFGQLSSDSSLQSVSQVLGASPRIDYGNSDFDYRHNGVIGMVWEIRGPKSGVFGQILGGWSLSAIQRFQTGFPFTVHNGSDRNGDGQELPDRPDIGNASAPLNTRAVISSTCVTGFANPDASLACVDPNSVHFIEGAGLPNASTVGRNSLRTPGLDLLSVNIAKTFRFSERMRLQYGLSMFNAYNTVNLNSVRAFPNSFRTVNGTAANRFLDSTLLNSSGRSMRMLLKLSW